MLPSEYVLLTVAFHDEAHHDYIDQDQRPWDSARILREVSGRPGRSCADV